MQGIRREGKRGAILPNLSEFAGEQPFFSGVEQVVKKSLPLQIGYLKDGQAISVSIH